jgi:hypothetical protein
MIPILSTTGYFVFDLSICLAAAMVSGCVGYGLAIALSYSKRLTDFRDGYEVGTRDAEDRFAAAKIMTLSEASRTLQPRERIQTVPAFTRLTASTADRP